MSKILLLEDDVSLVDGLRYSLKKSGYDVTVVRTVEEAISNLPNLCQYDLLLLDVTLPDGTGFEVCERVREHDKQIPIIFLTASDEEVCIIRGLDLGGMTILPNHSCWGNFVPAFVCSCAALENTSRTKPRLFNAAISPLIC